MGAEFDLAENDAAAIFSARRIRSRLSGAQQPIDAFRETLKWGKQRLFSHFHDGASADDLVKAHAFLVDEVLREAWQRHLNRPVEGLALAAVGGYGRGELLPHSDVDLLLLSRPGAIEANKESVEAFMAFLWDIGLEVGASVRTVQDCLDVAANDITIITNLMEARLLTGDAPLFNEMQQALAPPKVWPVEGFFKAKIAEQQARYAKYDDTGYKLEPNVKEGPGGLRDIHTIAWVAKRRFGAQSLNELRTLGFLNKAECDELFAGQDFLWRVRFALHMLTNRREDRLLFDNQIKVAELFGYVDHDHNLAVEQFMQLYYRTIKSLSCLNDMLLQLLEESILSPLGDEPAKVLNRRFQQRGKFIEAVEPDVFRRQPHALIEVFLLMQKHPEIQGVRAETLRLIRRDRKLVDQGLRDDLHARSLFMEMFRTGTGLTRALRRMNRYGVLGRYLPTFGEIIGHMQYDLFHTLTVDEHTLYVVRNLRRMSMSRFAHELPFCHEVMLQQPRPELLYLAGLFHDIAKGRGGDHSELGAEDAIRFCLDHGLSQADADLVAWLVRNHLLMSLTAQRMDIHDPEVVTGFARKVGDQQKLDSLFLLTCADIRATNPKLWNSWRESLLVELYNGTTRTLQRGLDNPLQVEELMAESQNRALARLAQYGLESEQVQPIWQRFDQDYFLRHSPEELAWHLPEILNANEAQLPLVLVQRFEDRGTTVFVYTRDQDYLFGRSTGVLAKLGLNILDARINTTADGYTLDSYAVIEAESGAELAPHRHAEIVREMQQTLRSPGTTSVDVNRRISRRLKHFNTPTTVYFSQDLARQRTVLELITADRPGLLSNVGSIFAKRGILLDAAKIATIGERAEDVFFIADEQGQPITDTERLTELHAVLTRTLNRDGADEPTPSSFDI